VQRGNVVATFDCEVSPDELETLCFQPSGFSVRTTVTYCDPYSQERGRNGLFVGGDPINYFDPTGEDRVVGWYAGNPIIVKDNPTPGQNPFASTEHYTDPITQTVKDTNVSVGVSGSAGGVSVFDDRLTFGLTQPPTFSNTNFDSFDTSLSTGISLDFRAGFNNDEPTNALNADLGGHLGGGIGLDANGNPVEYSLSLGLGWSLTPLSYQMPLQTQKKCPGQ
jgi:hypothetical protein